MYYETPCLSVCRFLRRALFIFAKESLIKARAGVASNKMHCYLIFRTLKLFLRLLCTEFYLRNKSPRV